MAPSAAGQGEVVLERGQAIDRFVVLGLVGRGGMGEVYAAYDPELDRKVAIKLLRARGGSEDGKARLLREAQATAKLQHPNVVVVYDVGTFGDSVFIAMEFVEGRTVGGWLHAAKRTPREILDVYLAAGRGLAAAHAAGLVHRDFKPDNVMVTNDGQVRVMDFGLARQVGEVDASPKAVAIPTTTGASALDGFDADATMDLNAGGAAKAETPSGKYLSIKLTQTGAMLGTPAYMAPEQFAMKATDARTDQFSFCVALYEALYGARPFAGDTFLALMTSVTTGTVSPPPAQTKVQGWLRKVLLRGISVDPERRHSSMTALLAELQRDPTIRARRLVSATIVLACFVGALVVSRRFTGGRASLCRAGATKVSGIWEAAGDRSPRKEAIHAAFVATGKSYAETAFSNASRFLDAYVEKWIATYRESCEATHERGEQSAEVLDLRMSCLNDRLGSVRALSDLFAGADEKVVENAVVAAGSLPRIETCSDVSVLKAVVKPPEDDRTRRQVEELRANRARLVALRDSSKCAEAIKAGDELIAKARALGYAPLLAEVLEAGIFPRGDCVPVYAQSERAREGFASAIAARHDELAAELATLIAANASMFEVNRPDLSREWLQIARATSKRLGGRPLYDAWLDLAESSLIALNGDWSGAIAKVATVRAEEEKLLGPDHPDLSICDQDAGIYLVAAGRYAEAIAMLDRARGLTAKLLGSEHPRMAPILNNEAEALIFQGRFADAQAMFEEAYGIFEKAGADRFFLSYPLTGLGVALLGQGKASEAIDPLERALAARSDPRLDVERVAETRFALARALWFRADDRLRARSLAQQALADFSKVKTPTVPIPDIAAWLRSPSTKAPPNLPPRARTAAPSGSPDR
jgi:tRNA A-37 threonylcarbamoyl transferase component Bud32/tetratricopeptide (TPR) repeat protein